MTMTLPAKETRRAKIKNQGHGLPSIGDTVLLDGEGLTDAIAIRRILAVAEPTKARNGQLWQPHMTVEGDVIRNVGSVEFCVCEYVATARLLPA